MVTLENKIIKNARSILIIYPFDIIEVLESVSGGSRLVKEEIKYLRYIGKNVTIKSLNEISIFGKILTIFQNAVKYNKNIVKEIVKKKKTSPFGHFLLPIVLFVTEILLWFDPKYRKSLRKISSTYDLIIVSYFISGAITKKITKKPTAVLEHNVEYIFLKEKFKILGLKNWISRIVLQIYEWIEAYNLRNVDYIFCLSDHDKKIIVEKFKLDESKIAVWVPLIISQKLLTNVKDMREKLREKEKVIIGFIGSDAAHNIDAVEKIIELAQKLIDEKVEFWIIGKVGEIFKDRNIKLLKNIKFLGFVDNLNKVLGNVDIWINPKFTSITGIEIKMFDYIGTGKPIISTSSGALGFENLIGKQVLIGNSIEEMAKIIQSLTSKVDKF